MNFLILWRTVFKIRVILPTANGIWHQAETDGEMSLDLSKYLIFEYLT